MFRTSDNTWDWLGPGVYFWEANPRRGLDFAKELQAAGRGSITEPAVVGAVISPGLCLDLTSLAGISVVQNAHTALIELYRREGESPPQNHPDLLRRNLDCAVIKHFHAVRNTQNQPPVDTVRGVFIEGGPLYENSGFFAKTHIQIAVCNPNCIKGVFRVRPQDLD